VAAGETNTPLRNDQEPPTASNQYTIPSFPASYVDTEEEREEEVEGEAGGEAGGEAEEEDADPNGRPGDAIDPTAPEEDVADPDPIDQPEDGPASEHAGNDDEGVGEPDSEASDAEASDIDNSLQESASEEASDEDNTEKEIEEEETSPANGDSSGDPDDSDDEDSEGEGDGKDSTYPRWNWDDPGENTMDYLVPFEISGTEQADGDTDTEWCRMKFLGEGAYA
jgi:hypothetical protein